MTELIDLKLMVTLAIPALIAIAGWLVGHWLHSARELTNQRRERRLKGLETAYNRLAMASVRDLTDEHKLELEKFVAEIQLYGTPRQIVLMQAMVTAYTRDPRVDFDPLLEDLRNTLRKELRMEPVTGPVWWLRFKTPEWKRQEHGAQQGAPADGPRPAGEDRR